MDVNLRNRLLESIDAGRLMILCGAGLSMAKPSGLPSAKKVAEVCFDTYRTKIDPGCDAKFRGNLEAFAEYFAERNQLESYFLDTLVPWQDFRNRDPNVGHIAVADFLMTRAIAGTLCTNYDDLIEKAGRALGGTVNAAIDGNEAEACSARAFGQGPFLKFHGCAVRDPKATVWTQSQLDKAPIVARLATSKKWMTARLLQKDLLVLGFWSDWAYLNQILDNSFDQLTPRSVIVVDPTPTNELAVKAQHLWNVAHREGGHFEHVQASASETLDELRVAFSQSYLRQMLEVGRETFIERHPETAVSTAWFAIDSEDSSVLYGWRRDAEGVPSSCPASQKTPISDVPLAYFHLLMRSAGAVQHEVGYSLNDRLIRVVRGSGKVLSQMQASFLEAPSVPAAHCVVAVGATDFGLPGNVVRENTPSSIVRPAPAGRWLTLDSARAELGI